MKKEILKICEWCSGDFLTKFKRTRFCCDDCKNKARNEREKERQRKKKIPRFCEKCKDRIYGAGAVRKLCDKCKEDDNDEDDKIIDEIYLQPNGVEYYSERGIISKNSYNMFRRECNE